jgi:hypothetical protein
MIIVWKVARDARSGRFRSLEYARRFPSWTVVETMKRVKRRIGKIRRKRRNKK